MDRMEQEGKGRVQKNLNLNGIFFISSLILIFFYDFMKFLITYLSM